MNVCGECGSVAPGNETSCPHCPGAVDPGCARERVDGRYELVRVLGEGSFARVWLAYDVGLRRNVALKMLSGVLASSAEDVQRFQREASALATMRNDHVAQVHAFGAHEGTFFFAMELVEGVPLSEIIREHAAHGDTLSLHRALVVLRAVAQGLSAVHSAGLVHRDVKPDNIVIERRTGRSVLVDFGLAQPSDGTGLRETSRLGTPAYMAPEQIRGEPLGPAADIYALGCTAFELLTGRLPYEADHIFAVLHAQLARPVPSLSSVRPSLAPLDAVITRAMAKQPVVRWESAAAFGAALEHAGRRWLAMQPMADEPFSREDDASPVTVRILVIDDDDDFARLAVRAAQIAFFGTVCRVTRARSGEEALGHAARKPMQIVLLDYQMPGLDGVETLSRLRELPGAQNTHVIVITGTASVAAEWRFRALGVERVLRKPVELTDLADEVHEVGRAAGWILGSTPDAPQGSGTREP